MREQCAAVTLGLVALLRAAPAAAQAPAPRQERAALSWQRQPGAESCPSVKDVSQRVDARLGHAAFVAPSDAEITLEATIGRASNHTGWELTIRMFGAPGEDLGNRQLSLAQVDCSEAVDNAALALALMIDPDALTRHAASFEADPTPVVAAPSMPLPSGHQAAVASAPCAPPEPPPAAKHWRARLALGFAGSLGQLPLVGASVAGVVRLSPPAQRGGFELGGRRFFRQRDEVRADAGVLFQATSVELSAFWSPVQSALGHVSLGAGFALGQIQADAFNLNTSSRSASSWLANALLNAELGWSANERWSILLRPELAIPVVRDRFEIGTNQGVNVVFRPTLVGQATVGLGFSL